MSDFILNEVRKRMYLDSVALMRISRVIKETRGVREAALMMGTPSNQEILADAGLLADSSKGAQGSDLIIGIRAESEMVARTALAEALNQISAPKRQSEAETVTEPRSVRGALKIQPNTTIALISVPGEFAIAEGRKAITRDLHVMIFSDNVPIEQEVALKQEAQKLGRLVMGPDCGTAIINGVPLAFANKVNRGNIGVIGASGTGIQEVTTLISKFGGGISHAIGVGGRDLSSQVGGVSTLMAIEMLDSDSATTHIVIISKPPDTKVIEKILERVNKSRKKFTICFLGADDIQVPWNARFAPTLKAAAELALSKPIDSKPLKASDIRFREGLIAGLYSGGTLCTEAQYVLMREARRSVTSNIPLKGVSYLKPDDHISDRVIDLGADEFTKGKPHPMIDPSTRDEMLRNTLRDPSVGAVLLDVVIGYGAHSNPAGNIAAVLNSVPERRATVIASVTGTDDDPQNRASQQAILEQSDVIVAASNVDAVRIALNCVQSGQGMG